LFFSSQGVYAWVRENDHLFSFSPFRSGRSVETGNREMPKHFFHITLTTLLFYVLSSNFLTAPCLAESPAQIQDIQSGVLKIPGMNLKVQFYADNIVRIVKWLPDG
jgi:hypothetical protein